MVILLLISLFFYLNIFSMNNSYLGLSDSLDNNSSEVALTYSATEQKLSCYCNHCSHQVLNIARHLKYKILTEYLKCKHCNLPFQNYYFLAAHQVDYWKEHFACATCTQIFTNQNEFTAHTCPHARPKKEKAACKTEKKKDYFCVCTRTFETPSGLYKHKSTCQIYKTAIDALAIK